VWLTPHLHKLSPAPAFPTFLLTGSYNAGFIAVRNAVDGRQFLSWLQARVARECVRDFSSGLFVDQKWLDLAAAVCPGVRPLRYPGLNAGHWNLHEFSFETRGDDVLIDGVVRLALFHFSGLTPDALSRHGSVNDVPPAIAALTERYGKLLEVRTEVLRALEAARRDKLIGSGLEAQVTVSSEGERLALLRDAEGELPALFIVSRVALAPGSLAVNVERAPGEKCDRCWIYTEDRGRDPVHPTLCAKCAAALA
jgi:hypothetical protein